MHENSGHCHLSKNAQERQDAQRCDTENTIDILHTTLSTGYVESTEVCQERLLTIKFAMHKLVIGKCKKAGLTVYFWTRMCPDNVNFQNGWSLYTISENGNR